MPNVITDIDMCELVCSFLLARCGYTNGHMGWSHGLVSKLSSLGPDDTLPVSVSRDAWVLASRAAQLKPSSLVLVFLQLLMTLALLVRSLPPPVLTVPSSATQHHTSALFNILCNIKCVDDAC